MPRPRKYSEELLERGVRLALESGRAVAHVAADLGVNSEVLRKRVRQDERLLARIGELDAANSYA